jgi:hypothetical protein
MEVFKKQRKSQLRVEVFSAVTPCPEANLLKLWMAIIRCLKERQLFFKIYNFSLIAHKSRHLFWNTLYDVSGLWPYNSVVTADLF